MLSATIELRTYRPEDLEVVAQLWYETWTRTFPDLAHLHTAGAFMARFRDEIAETHTVWLAEAAGSIAGFLAINTCYGVIDQVFVRPDAHGAGVGSALIAKAKALCPTNLTLTTLTRNVRARAFYERHGFQPGAEDVNPVNGQPNIRYHWRPAYDQSEVV